MMSASLAPRRGVRAVLGTLPFLVASCDGDAAAQQEGSTKAPPVSVVVVEVESRTIGVTRDFVARTEAVDTVEIEARVEAILETLEFDEGRRVKKDQVLFRLDAATYEAEVAVAEAALAQADANLKLALEQVSVRAAEAALVQAKATLKKTQQDVARLRPLAEKDAVPRQDLDTALAAEEVAQAEVEAMEAQLTNSRIQEEVGILMARAAVKSATAALDLTKLDLEYCTIRSPLDGLIGRTQVSVGNLVGRGETTTLATISSIDPIYVTFSISEAEYLAVTAQQRAEGRINEDDESDRELSEPVQLILADDSVYEQTGLVVIGDRAVAEETGTLQIVAEFPNPDGQLRPGQFGRARLEVAKVENALLVPQRAVMEQQSTKVVLVVGEGDKVALRSIQVSDRFEGKFVVSEGLSAGDRVIIEGQLKARPGAVVAPTFEAATSEQVPSEPATEDE